MGNQNQKQKSKSTKAKNLPMKCPKCHKVFPQGYNLHQFANHLRNCFEGDSSHQPEQLIQLKKSHYSNEPFQYEKIARDYTMTTFKWCKKPLQGVNSSILGKAQHQVKKLSFQEKQYWFRNKIEKLRISWQYGADFMKLQKNNILMNSLIQTKKVNMHKEVKIDFIGEKVNDAGGLLREWIHMVIKQVFDESTGIFTLASSDDIMYKLKWDSDLDEQFSCELFQLFGIIVGKSIFQRIPLTCYLDRTILRQICQSSVKIEDIYGFDKDLYKTWNFILETDNLEDMETYFVINKDTGETIQEIQLMENGRDIPVTNKNKFHYVDACIQTITMDMVKRSINSIKKGINKVVPTKLLSIFQPYEMEMILYGVPFIDLNDWKNNTNYKQPYSVNHKVIKWFWKVMEEFDQEKLANLLHFCTGSSRTPIHGFKKLQSNRGNYSKFLIVQCEYVKSNPYPKGHTCFNRLQLPNYPSFQMLKVYLEAICKNNLDGVFGLD